MVLSWQSAPGSFACAQQLDCCDFQFADQSSTLLGLCLKYSHTLNHRGRGFCTCSLLSPGSSMLWPGTATLHCDAQADIIQTNVFLLLMTSITKIGWWVTIALLNMVISYILQHIRYKDVICNGDKLEITSKSISIFVHTYCCSFCQSTVVYYPASVVQMREELSLAWLIAVRSKQWALWAEVSSAARAVFLSSDLPLRLHTGWSILLMKCWWGCMQPKMSLCRGYSWK